MLISIVIPTKNRNEILLESLDDAIKSIENFDAEIIVVNDGVAIKEFPSCKKVTLLENHQRGVSAARNKGAKAAKGDVLYFIDDDMSITPESLLIIQNLYEQKMLEHSCFNLNWVYPAKLQETLKVKKIGRYILHSSYHTLEGRMHTKINPALQINEAGGVASCSFCISAVNFEKINGYNEKILFQGEDIDIALRLQRNNIATKIITKITCFHNQKDRLEIDEYLDRIYRGYTSQSNADMIDMSAIKQHLLSILLPFFPVIKFVYNKIPNLPFFDKLSFRLIGLLSSITYLKAIKETKRNT
ncbi:MAG: glycosyltransferase family 2 protein [Sphingobacteriales bacterium]|nr:glycosyltransferase family 2 protein [Sphingobacteriales bacterium]MBP8192029.1 glycosyltransferase family 2 protein [Chitinophagales bacterium]